jgi:SHS2 domain-containing protein
VNKNFEILSHTADLKIRVYGKTIEDLFRNALVGMFQSIGPQSSKCRSENGNLVCDKLPIERTLQVTAPNQESLLIDFLSHALSLSDIHNEAYLDVDIHYVDEKRIDAMLRGIEVEGFEVVEIKAVTYHGLKIEKKNERWQTDIVFDI